MAGRSAPHPVDVTEVIVADSGPLIALAQIGRLELLRVLYDRVTVPPAVAREVAPSLGPLPTWIDVRRPSLPLVARPPREGLHVGEYEAFLLAIELEADLVLVDDRGARRWARARDLPIVGTVGVLLRAKDQGVVARVRPVLDALVATGLYLSDALYREVLETAGELSEDAG